MKGFILIVLAVIAAVLVIGGVGAFHVMNEIGIGLEDISPDTIGDIMDKVSNVGSSDSSDSGSSDGSVIDKEEVKFNHQNGEGSYREVTYSDGGFRQYDTKTGDLIGSSYDSDQKQLNNGDFD